MTIYSTWGITLADIEEGKSGVLFYTRSSLEETLAVYSETADVFKAVLVAGDTYQKVSEELHGVAADRYATTPTIDALQVA